MTAGSSERIIVSSTIDLAHNLGLRAIAEGVEDLEQVSELQDLGCDAVQGYAISQADGERGRDPMALEIGRPTTVDRRPEAVA